VLNQKVRKYTMNNKNLKQSQLSSTLYNELQSID
jgi:hypothetical protein